MQTVLGSGGQIAEELTRELRRNFTDDIRLVGRNPRKVHETDQLVPADLMDAEATDKAVVGSEVVYLTVGLPMDSGLWELIRRGEDAHLSDGVQRGIVRCDIGARQAAIEEVTVLGLRRPSEI